jgi:3-deoxy-D-manno-octulosonic-acid transferase
MPAAATPRAPLPWRAAYNAAVSLAAAASLPVAVAASLLGRPWAAGLGERLGAAPRLTGRPAWFHCASVGEQRAFEPLLRALAERHPSLPLALSVTTASGRHAASALADRLSAPAFHVPADAWPFPGRALGRLRPRLLGLVETELWPNLLAAAARRNVPALLVNGRLEERSFQWYRRARPLFGTALAGLKVLAMRSAEDAERVVALGVPADRVHVTGNLKFDEAARLARSEDRLDWAAAAGLEEGPWIVAGSTAAGEEELLLAAFTGLLRERPELRLALAPRRPERWDEVAGAIESRGLPLLRRSRLAAGSRPVEGGGVLLLDSVGELARLYRHGELAFVGGSLVPRGGQNPLEAAATGRPVLFGPHCFHFRDAESALLRAGGAIRSTPERLETEMAALLADDDRRRSLGTAAREAVLAGEGAADRTLELIEPWLGAGAS